MKLTALLLTAAFLNVGATGISQNITYRAKNVPLKTVFAELKKQSGFYFFCDEALLEKTAPVTINAKQEPLFTVLDKVLKPQQLNYTVKGNNIIVSEIFQVDDNPAPTISDALPPPINGIIRDADGNPLQGVNVVIKGTKIGVTTNAEGKFSIEAKENDVLVISSIGYNAREVKVSSVNVPYIIVLDKSVSELDEVQYIAYGTQTRRFSVGNVATVTSKDIESQPVNNPLLALTGRVPGLVVSQANGVPGGGITIRIQGRNNLDNRLVGSDPFIVIDGVPYPSQNLSTFLGGTFNVQILGSSSNDASNSANYFGNPLAFINVADIESITVLKDADATAIYGSRAANGAILITTKKGKTGKMKTEINIQQGWGQVPKKMDLLDSRQYMEMRWEAKKNDGQPVSPSDYDLRGVWDTTRYTDWQESLIGGTAQFGRFTTSVSGGVDNFNYLISSTYGKETTVFPGEFANTFGSLHFSLSTTSANQRFRLQLGGNYMANINKLPAEDYTNQALNLPPIAPALRNSDGSLNWAPDPLTGSSTWWNPLSWQYKLFETKTNNLVSNASVSYRILPSVEFKSTFGFTSNTSDQFVAPLNESEKPEQRGTRIRRATFSFNTQRSWIVEPQMSWQQKFERHTLSVLAGATFQSQDNSGRAFLASGHANDLVLRDMLGGTTLNALGVDVNEYKYNALFGRINYTFRDKILFNVSARRDGSSRFGPQSQFNNFGAVGAGWILSEECFVQHGLPFISFAKIRGSYGTTGNDQIGNYRFLNLYQSFYAGIPYQGEASANPLGLPNPVLEWEETRKLQGGLDMGFWNDRVLLMASYFRNRSSNSLTEVEMPLIAGFNSVVINLPALIQNTGWEFSLNTVNVKTKSFRWNSSVNLTIPRNKLLAFPGIETSPLVFYLNIGQPLSTLKGYAFHSLDPLTGVYLIKNRNGDPTTSPGIEDLTVFTNTTQRWFGGFQNYISYKGITFDCLLQFTKQKDGNVRTLGTGHPGAAYFDDNFFMFGNQPISVMNRWQKPGDNSTVQRFTTINALSSPGDLGYEDVSFMRLKNISISYQVHVRHLQKIKFHQLRIYSNVQNLFTITRYKGLDPETRSVYNLPPLRIVTVGVQANF